MSKQLTILFAASEIYPIAKTGGLADVAYGLPLALRDLEHDVRVMLPKYGGISERKNRIHEINRLKDIPIPMGTESEPATVKSSSITNPRTKVQAYMTTNHRYFDSKWGLYADPETGEEYADNDERFIFFSRTVLETCTTLGFVPDVLHIHDWQTALVAAYMREIYPDKFKNTKIVLTLHNVSAQGIFPFESTFAKTGFPEESKKIFEHKGQFNFLKAGIMYADHITTVSPSYGQQILEDEELTNGLNILLKEREKDFTPIINGIDTTTWDPFRDKHIKKPYSIDTLDRKMLNKQALVNEFKLSYHENIPVIALLSRLVPQKGIDIVMEAAETFLQRNVQFVVLGEGEKRFEDFFTNLAKKYPTKVAFKKSFDEVMAHKVEAGADIYLMPSLFEPCGLNQMYSCVYGTVPVVRATGGLRDTITEFDVTTKQGNGFLFEEFKGTALVEALGKALDAFANRPLWQQLIRNCMKSDFSWTTSAKQYADIYRRLLDQ